MKFTRFFILFAIVGLFLTGCGDTASKDGEGGKETPDNVDGEQPKDEAAQLSFEKDGLKLTAMEDSPEYADASLQLNSPETGVDLAVGSSPFDFTVENYELGMQTPGADKRGLANSGKGQHIHFILNNGPYSAHYEPQFEKELEEGQYVLLAFLARSYHESVKTPGAAVIQQFNVGVPEEFTEVNLNMPHMFYSRPKGTYSGDDTKKLLLDFYLANCDLGPDSYKVKATINGVEFTLTKWVPYIIEGLPLGEVNIKLELIDKDGNLVKSPFNPVERVVTLAAAS